MLHIYFARENVDKAKFIFGNAGAKSLVLVPDQFTLEAEKEALRCLAADGIMDSEILSISRLGFRMLSEMGGIKKNRIDTYGRHMLITAVTNELAQAGALDMFGSVCSKKSFVQLANDFISSLKQHRVTPDMLCEIKNQAEGRELLSRKLDDIEKIYRAYQLRLEGRFVDAEDCIDMYIPAARESEFVKDRDIWVWGFDSFTPKNVQLIMALAESTDVNVVMTSVVSGRDKELFDISRYMILRFEKEAEALGIEFRASQIDDETAVAMGPGFFLEKELFAIPITPDHERIAADNVTLVSAANYYSEAEAAAAYITGLVRDKGLRYRDIFVCCNDIEGRGAIIKRVFAEYGINIFTDEKKDILHNPAVVYILSLLDIISKGYRSADIFRMLKTGLAPVGIDEAEELENYAIKYRIRGNAWKKSFEYGREEYGDEEFEKLEEIREKFISFVDEFDKAFKTSRKASDRIAALYDFLSGSAGLPLRIKAYIKEKEECGMTQSAQEMAQIWDSIMHIFDQIVNVIGDEKPSMETLSELLEAGFAAIEIGLLPPSADGLVLGTMQRTRTGHIKALVVIGANDGLLPKEMTSEDLLSEDEKMFLASNGFEICSLDDLRLKEERLAIYRTFARASEYLYMSYAASDASGAEQKPSRIFTAVSRVFPSAKVQKDLDDRQDKMALIESRESALNHFVRALRETKSYGTVSTHSRELAEEWQNLACWYSENDKESFDKAVAGLFYKNRKERLAGDTASRLYIREGSTEFAVSPSRLEKYSRCPFAHFINYGLRPDERRVFTAGSREIGDVYHECLMEFSKRLTEEDKWQQISRHDSDAMVKEILCEISAAYKEGLMDSGSEESYRKTRMESALTDVAWTLVLQARAGIIQSMYFEEAFGRDAEKAFPAIEVNTSKGTVYIEGKIDRVDILSNGNVKIIDYKSGNEKFNAEEARKGWRLQLMLYLKAASGIRNSDVRRSPAGVFYFMIKDADIDCEKLSREEIADQLSEAVKKEFKMNGLIVDAPGNVENIAGEFDGWSDIIGGLRKSKGEYSGCIIGEEEFDELSAAFDHKIEELCDALAGGEIAAKPKRVKDVTACRYCQYKSICRFDVTLAGCTYEKIM